jgi:hypothetical protein
MTRATRNTYYFFTLIFLLVASRANFLSFIEPFIYVFTVIYFIAGVQLNRFTQSDFRLFAKFTIIYFAYITVRYLFLNNLSLVFYAYDVTFYLKRFIFVFVYCALLKEQAIVYLVKVTTHLALISLFFYPLQLISGNIVFSIGDIIHLPPRAGNPDYTNFFVFTYDRGQPMRNCGFVWEPGAYGCFAVLALLMHFTLNKFKFDRNALILVLAIITTLSTTAYLGMLFVFLLFYRFNGGKLAPFLFLVVPIIAVIALEVPILFDKIGKTYDGDQQNLNSLDDLNRFYERTGGQIPLNRFASATIIYNLFTYKLIWGISNGYQGVNKALKFVNISNGDADMVAKFGVVGYCFFLYKYGLLFKRVLQKNEYVFYCIMVFLVLAFGECMPIFHSSLAFLFLYHYVGPDTFSINKTDEEEEDEEETEHDGVILNGSN